MPAAKAGLTPCRFVQAPITWTRSAPAAVIGPLLVFVARTVGEPIGSLRALVEDCGLARSRRHDLRRIQLARRKQSTSKNFCTFPVGVWSEGSVWITIVRGVLRPARRSRQAAASILSAVSVSLAIWRCDDQRTDALAPDSLRKLKPANFRKAVRAHHPTPEPNGARKMKFGLP
jgi:hypothetical protein